MPSRCAEAMHGLCTPHVYIQNTAQAAAAAEGSNDLGSRKERGNRIEQHAAALAEESKVKRAKYVVGQSVCCSNEHR